MAMLMPNWMSRMSEATRATRLTVDKLLDVARAERSDLQPRLEVDGCCAVFALADKRIAWPEGEKKCQLAARPPSHRPPLGLACFCASGPMGTAEVRRRQRPGTPSCHCRLQCAVCFRIVRGSSDCLGGGQGDRISDLGCDGRILSAGVAGGVGGWCEEGEWRAGWSVT